MDLHQPASILRSHSKAPCQHQAFSKELIVASEIWPGKMSSQGVLLFVLNVIYACWIGDIHRYFICIFSVITVGIFYIFQKKANKTSKNIFSKTKKRCMWWDQLAAFAFRAHRRDPKPAARHRRWRSKRCKRCRWRSWAEGLFCEASPEVLKSPENGEGTWNWCCLSTVSTNSAPMMMRKQHANIQQLGLLACSNKMCAVRKWSEPTHTTFFWSISFYLACRFHLHSLPPSGYTNIFCPSRLP